MLARGATETNPRADGPHEGEEIPCIDCTRLKLTRSDVVALGHIIRWTLLFEAYKAYVFIHDVAGSDWDICRLDPFVVDGAIEGCALHHPDIPGCDDPLSLARLWLCGLLASGSRLTSEKVAIHAMYVNPYVTVADVALHRHSSGWRVWEGASRQLRRLLSTLDAAAATQSGLFLLMPDEYSEKIVAAREVAEEMADLALRGAALEKEYTACRAAMRERGDVATYAMAAEYHAQRVRCGYVIPACVWRQGCDALLPDVDTVVLLPSATPGMGNAAVGIDFGAPGGGAVGRTDGSERGGIESASRDGDRVGGERHSVTVSQDDGMQDRRLREADMLYDLLSNWTYPNAADGGRGTRGPGWRGTAFAARAGGGPTDADRRVGGSDVEGNEANAATEYSGDEEHKGCEAGDCDDGSCHREDVYGEGDANGCGELRGSDDEGDGGDEHSSDEDDDEDEDDDYNRDWEDPYAHDDGPECISMEELVERCSLERVVVEGGASGPVVYYRAPASAYPSAETLLMWDTGCILNAAAACA